MTGKAVVLEVLPEEPSRTRRIDMDNPPVGMSVLVNDDGTAWKDHRPVGVVYTDPDGREWRLPWHWLSDGVSPVIGASRYEVTQASRWTESWVPPTLWDLGDINFQDVPGPDGGLGAPEIEVRVAPGEIPKVFWRGSSRRMWRIPHDWRRRRDQATGLGWTVAERLVSRHSGKVRQPDRRDVAIEIGRMAGDENVFGMVARHFVRAVNELAAASKLKGQNLGTVFTYLGENVKNPAEAQRVTEHYLDVLDRIRSLGLGTEISVKLTQLGLDLDPELCYANLAKLIEHAGAGSVVWIDMESSNYTDITLNHFRRARFTYPNVGMCAQAYLYRTEEDLASLIPLSAAVLLVKGAHKGPQEKAFPHKALVDKKILKLAREGWKSIVLVDYGDFWFPWYMPRLAERPANVWFVVRKLLKIERPTDSLERLESPARQPWMGEYNKVTISCSVRH